MVAGLQRPVAEPLVHGQHCLVPVGEDARSGHEHLVGRGRGGCRAVAPAQPGAALLAPPSLHHVAVVAGEHHQPAGSPGRPEQWGEVLDGLRGPVGAAGIGAVEGVVDGVEHAPDEPMPLGVGDREAHVVGDGEALSAGIEVLLVEQRCFAQSLRRGDGGEVASLGVLLPARQPTRLGWYLKSHQRETP